MSVPDRTTTEAAAPRQTARKDRPNHERHGTRGAPACSSPGLPHGRVDEVDEDAAEDAEHLRREEHPRGVPHRGGPHGQRGQHHERELEGRGVEGDGAAAVVVGDGGDDGLPDDRERRDDEQPGHDGEDEQRQVAHEGRDAPADERDDERGRDDPPQAEPVEQPSAPGSRDGDGHGRGRREEPGLGVGAAERGDDVDGEQDAAGEDRPAHEGPEDEGGAQRPVRQGTAVGREVDGGHGVSRGRGTWRASAHRRSASPPRRTVPPCASTRPRTR